LTYSLRSAYHARNGYHNFSHAVDVAQAIYSFLTSLQLVPPLSILMDDSGSKWQRPASVEGPHALGTIIRPMDAFTLLIAAVGHDVGHPGLSNAYMVNAKTPVAQVYDNSVLENFHTVTLIQMLQQHGLGDIFGAANTAQSSKDDGAFLGFWGRPSAHISKQAAAESSFLQYWRRTCLDTFPSSPSCRT
jgi:hypothetical protein